MLNKLIAIIIFGPPGAGKGTIAAQLAEGFDLEQLDTGRIIEKKVNDPELQNDPIIQREKENFTKGRLCTAEWVDEIGREEIEKLYKNGKSIVSSGWPRSLSQAQKALPLLKKLYGQDNIFILRLIIKPETSIFRNSHRKICQSCNNIIPASREELKKCPKCGGKLERRALDNPETIRIRLKEYKKQTEPMYKFFEKNKIEIIDIDGEPSPEDVYKNVLNALKSRGL